MGRLDLAEHGEDTVIVGILPANEAAAHVRDAFEGGGGGVVAHAEQTVRRGQSLLPEHLTHGELHVVSRISLMAYQMLQSLERVCRLNIDNDPEMVIVAAGAESSAALGDAVIVGFRQGKETTGQLTGGDHQFIHGGLNPGPRERGFPLPTWRCFPSGCRYIHAG